MTQAMKTLGTHLKDLRTGSGLTLRQIEEATGVSNAYLSQLENDKIKKPSANVLYKLAKMYGTTIDSMLLIAGYIKETTIDERNRTICGLPLTEDEEAKLIEYLHWLRHKNG